jgi:hypothetical protein
MIQIEPTINHRSNCPYCQEILQNQQILWQGMFVCVSSRCNRCQKNIIQDLKIGHGNRFNYQVDIEASTVFGDPAAEAWLGTPLLKSLKSPEKTSINITKKVFHISQKVVILNCIDFLYGHCLLKLLNAERHLNEHPDYGLVIIAPDFLCWLVPNGVAEIWSINLPIKRGQCYFPEIDQFIKQETKRFAEVCVSRAYSHPSKFNISNFTKIAKHDFASSPLRVTFIWREDRLWSNSLISIIPLAGKWWQNFKVSKFFSRIKKDFPNTIFTVVGMGKSTNFPDWIEDARVESFNNAQEILACEIYRDSRLVLGVHGSNMLLPSAHAGMTIDLLPPDRLGNFAQDILYQEPDPRLAAFRYRYIPLTSSVHDVSKLAILMLTKLSGFMAEMTADNSP